MYQKLLTILFASCVVPVALAQGGAPPIKNDANAKQEHVYSTDDAADAYAKEKYEKESKTLPVVDGDFAEKDPGRLDIPEKQASEDSVKTQEPTPAQKKASPLPEPVPNRPRTPMTISEPTPRSTSDPESGDQRDTSAKVLDALKAMGVELEPEVRKQIQEIRDAEEKLKEIGQARDKPDPPNPKVDDTQPPSDTSAKPRNAKDPVDRPADTPGNGKVAYEDKSGYKDRWYYELLAPVAVNLFTSLLDEGLPPAPVVKPISTSHKGPAQRIEQEIVIVSADLTEAENLERQLASRNLALKRREVLDNIGIVTSVFDVPVNLSVPDIIVLLRQQHPGVWIDENNIYRFMDGTVFYPKQKIQWPTREANYCARDLKIGLVDTGVDVNHPALSGQNIVTRKFYPAEAAVPPEDHGTALATLLVGSPVYPEHAGLLPNAQLYVAEAFRSAGGKRGSTFSTTETVIKALNWLVGEEVKTINLSFGGPRNLITELVVHKLLNRGFSIVAAAGNSGVHGPPMYPAAQNGVVAVTATDQRNSLYRSATRGAYIDFAAPGVDIWTATVTDPSDEGFRGRYRSGTSYAAPFVTGIVAIVRNSGWNAYEFLTDHTIDLGPDGKDQEFGWGLVQVPFTCPTTTPI